MNFLLPYSVLLYRLRILEFIILLSVCIYSTYCTYIIITGILEPQPIIRNEADLNHSSWKQRYNQEIPVINSEMPLSYLDVFSVQSERYLCATSTGSSYGSVSDEIQVCFLKLSAEDANWIRQKFANVPLGRLLNRNDHLGDEAEIKWGSVVQCYTMIL